jgi:biotin-dependent carboxylase-like uncharacterized protein
MTTVQDSGRFGYQKIGLTTGGCMDEHASGWANKLLENNPSAPVLEITLGNLQLEAEVDTWIAVTGADQQFTINGTPRANWQSHYVQAGDVLNFSWAREGMRTYLAVLEGFQVAEQFGSCSTVVREAVGGIEGRSLQKGDFLNCKACSQDRFVSGRSVPFNFIPDFSEALVMDVVLGYQKDDFSKSDIQLFFSSEYKVNQDSDRMGYRLDGEALNPNLQGIYSEGISFGAIQVPANGLPIILLKDRQTLGGYPKLGTVVSVDAFRLSQCRPGHSVTFREVSLNSAQTRVREFYQFFS